MTDLKTIKAIIETQKPYLLKEYGVDQIGVFGSYVRGDQQTKSDIDILIHLNNRKPITLISLARMQRELSELMGVKADIALKDGLKKRIGERILKEVVYL